MINFCLRLLGSWSCAPFDGHIDTDESLFSISNSLIPFIMQNSQLVVLLIFQFLLQGDKIPAKAKCPLDYFGPRSKHMDVRTDFMNYGPGEIMFSAVRSRNNTHIEVVTTMHYLAYLSDPVRTKYIITLRNPTDRFVLYYSAGLSS